MSFRAPRAVLYAFVAMVACGRGDDTRVAREETPTEEFDWDHACQQQNSRWHCRIARNVVVDVVPHLDSTDTATVKHLALLEILPQTATASGQTLMFADFQGMPQAGDISVSDLDGDGYGDLRVRHQYGISANEGHYIWRYRPMDGQFVYDALLSEETNVSADSTGCVSTQAMVGHAGGDVVQSRYCLRGNSWKLVRKVDQHVNDSLGATITDTFALRGDSLQLVGTDSGRTDR